jgi:hypothetical protein
VLRVDLLAVEGVRRHHQHPLDRVRRREGDKAEASTSLKILRQVKY